MTAYFKKQQFTAKDTGQVIVFWCLWVEDGKGHKARFKAYNGKRDIANVTGKTEWQLDELPPDSTIEI